MFPYGSNRKDYDQTYREERGLGGKGIKHRARRLAREEIRRELDARAGRRGDK